MCKVGSSVKNSLLTDFDHKSLAIVGVIFKMYIYASIKSDKFNKHVFTCICLTITRGPWLFFVKYYNNGRTIGP